MKKEDKELLLKDLSARLLCNVKCHVKKIGGTLDVDWNIDTFWLNKTVSDNYEIKPYLRPMSSMTEEEMDKIEEILGDKCIFDFMGNGDVSLHQGDFTQNTLSELYDFYNSIHIDYRGLISKGLAIEVTEENNPYK